MANLVARSAVERDQNFVSGDIQVFRTGCQACTPPEISFEVANTVAARCVATAARVAANPRSVRQHWCL